MNPKKSIGTKNSGEYFYINAKLIPGTGVAADLTSIQSNWSTEDESDRNPDGNYSMYRGRILAMGYINVTLPEYYDNSTVLADETDVLVYYNQTQEEEKKLQWDSEKGFLFEFVPSNVYKDLVYHAIIEWTLVDAP